MSKNAPSYQLDIISSTQKVRLVAFRKVKKLPDKEALPILKKGLEHWDRKLRNLCAREIVHRIGSKAAPIVLPLRSEGRLYASCSSEELLKHEDPALIRYLKRKHDNEDLDALTKSMLVRTKYHAKLEAAKADKEAEKARQKLQKKLDRAREAIATKGPTRYEPQWCMDPEIQVLSEVDPRFADYVHRHWSLDRGMDNLYKVSQIPKRSGGMRQIEAPRVSLKMVQRAVLEHVFGNVNHHEACHGFRTGRSIATNASSHVGKDVVLNLDLQDFFPSVTAQRVYGVYRSFVGEGVYTRFLTDISVFKGRLPQGAPTSPMIANLVCIRLDCRLAGLAKKHGMDYTRYADDLTFSGSESVIRYIPAIKAIVASEGFRIALQKLRIHRKGSRQEVTGLTVNQQVSVPRAIRRRLRAAVHTATKGNTPTWKDVDVTPEALKGHITFVSSIHPDLGSKLLRQVTGNTKKKGK